MGDQETLLDETIEQGKAFSPACAPAPVILC